MVCSTYCEAPAKVSGGSRTLVCIKGFTFSHFSGKASAGAPDTRDDEAPPEKCNIYIYIYIYMDYLVEDIYCYSEFHARCGYIYIYIYVV